MVNTQLVHDNWRESEKEKTKLILPNDWSHVVKGKISLSDTGEERE